MSGARLHLVARAPLTSPDAPFGVGVGTQFEGTVAGGAQAVDYPDDLDIDDTAVAVIAQNSAAVPADQAGWVTQTKHSRLSDTALPNIWVGTRQIDGTEGATHTFTGLTNNASSAWIANVRNADPVPEDGVFSQSAASASPVATGVTTGGPNRLILAVFVPNSPTADLVKEPMVPGQFSVLAKRVTGARPAFGFWLSWPGTGATGNISPTLSASAVNLCFVMAFEVPQTAFSGPLAVSGEGTLSFGVGTPGLIQALALSGAGALSFAAIVGVSGTAALSGSGTLTLAGKPAVAGSLALSGVGSLYLAGVPGGVGTLALTGSGTMTPGTGIPGLTQTAPFSGEGTLSLTPGAVDVSGAAALSGSGSLSFGAQVAVSGPLGLSGDGEMTVAGKPGFDQPLGLSGDGSLSFGATFVAVSGALTLSGLGTLEASGGSARSGTAALSGEGTLSGGIGFPAVSGSLALSGDGSLSGAGSPVASGNLILGGSGALSVASFVAVGGTAVLSGQGSLSFTAVVEAGGLLELGSDGFLSLGPVAGVAGSLDLSGEGTLLATGVAGARAPSPQLRHTAALIRETESGAELIGSRAGASIVGHDFRAQETP